MGTRGLYGFHKNGIDKLTYNHLEAIPIGLGRRLSSSANVQVGTE